MSLVEKISNSYWNLVCFIFFMAIPNSLHIVTQYFINIINIYFLDTKLQVAAVGMGNMIISMSMFFVIGFTSSLCTLMGQSNGLGDQRKTIRLLHHTYLAAPLMIVPLIILVLNSGELLEQLGQDTEMIIQAKKYIWNQAFGGMVIVAWIDSTNLFLTCHGKTYISFFASGITVVFNIFQNQLFLKQQKYGIIGTAIANTLTQLTKLSILLISIGFSKESYIRDALMIKIDRTNLKYDIVAQLKLGVPAGFMMLLDGFVFEVMMILSGQSGIIAQSSQTIIMQITVVQAFTMVGFENTACTMLGWAIGAKNDKLALTVMQAFTIICFLIAISLSIFNQIFFLDVIKLMRDDNDIAMALDAIRLIYCAQLFFDVQKLLFRGLLRGLGLQLKGFQCNLAGHLFLNLGLQLYFCFQLKWGLTGIWISKLCLEVQNFIAYFSIVILSFRRVFEEIKQGDDEGDQMSMIMGHKNSKSPFEDSNEQMEYLKEKEQAKCIE